ncbi:MAG: NUDIX hydrolase [Bacteroidaceae bacterium]|nr:NUDIX hydrolase [Bacteroidaceae bacterium]
MYQYKYPHAALTTDAVVFAFKNNKLHVLLIERGNEPCKGKWAFPGGFLEMDETLEEGCKRELLEETGVDDIHVEELKSFSTVDRDPRERVVTVAFLAFIRHQDVHVVAGDDAAKAKWFAVDELPKLAFDHEEILREAFSAMRRRILFEPLAFYLLDKTFTLSELQTVYEAITGNQYDSKRFYSSIIDNDYVTPVDGSTDGQQRYKLNESAYIDKDRCVYPL